MTRILIIVALLAALAGAHWWDRGNAMKAGYAQGKQDALVEYLHNDVETLTDVITKTSALIDRVQVISNAIDQTLADNEIHNQQTTQEIHRALFRTADSRVNCRLDDDVMHQLAAARDRANQAAASGISYPVSTGTRSD